MSPSSLRRSGTPAAAAEHLRLRVALAQRIRDARQRRGWTLRKLAGVARVAFATVHAAEASDAVSLDVYVRLGVALGLRPEFDLADRRNRPALVPARDPVHAAMGEVLARRFSSLGYAVALDEPYQHYQFAGRGDLLAWDLSDRRLLHSEQRTRLPDIQETAGSFNAKRAYLAQAFARRLGLRDGFRIETHVLVLLWSAEVLHALRMRTATFRLLGPDGPEPFAAWWAGRPPDHETIGLAVFDPVEGQRSDRRRWVGLDDALSVRPRYRGYAEALQALRRKGLA